MSQDVKIHLATTADTSGAVATEQAIDDVNKSVLETAPASRAVGELTQAEIKAAEAAGSAAKQFNEAALAKIKAGQAARSAGLDMNKVGILANQASFQLGDMVTQVQMGTSAARAFSQQAPQLIGAFTSLGLVTGGVGMALAGISVAIPLVVMAFEKFGATTDTLKPKLEVLNDSIDKNAQLLTKAYEARLKDQQAAEESAQKWDALEQAKNQAATATLTNAQKELQAYEALNDALGIQLDLIGTKADMERAAREEAARQAQQAEAAKAGSATGAVADSAAKLNDLNAHIDFLTSKADESDRKIESLRQSMRDPAITGGVLAIVESQFANELGMKQGIERSIQGFSEQASALEQKIGAQTSRANDQIAAAEVAIQSIGESLNADNAVAAAKEIKERSKQQADDLNALLSDITPISDAQRTAVAELRQIASDGKVGADEMERLGRNLQTLLGGIQSGISEYNGTTQQLIDIVKQLGRDRDDLKGQIRSLKEKVESFRK